MIEQKGKRSLTGGKIIITVILLASAIFIAVTGYKIFTGYRIKMKYEKYSKIRNWQDAKTLFEADRENNELKFFSFGWGRNSSLDTLETKYGLEVAFMGDRITDNYLLYDYYVATEIIKDRKFFPRYHERADSIWEYFDRAMETRDIEYLIANSLDTIQCSELQIPSPHYDEYYDARFIFEHHLKELMQLDDLSTSGYSSRDEDSLIYIIYDIKSRQAPEGGYNLIFRFVGKGNRYYFAGMIMT